MVGEDYCCGPDGLDEVYDGHYFIDEILKNIFMI